VAVHNGGARRGDGFTVAVVVGFVVVVVRWKKNGPVVGKSPRWGPPRSGAVEGDVVVSSTLLLPLSGCGVDGVVDDGFGGVVGGGFGSVAGDGFSAVVADGFGGVMGDGLGGVVDDGSGGVVGDGFDNVVEEVVVGVVEGFPCDEGEGGTTPGGETAKDEDDEE